MSSDKRDSAVSWNQMMWKFDLLLFKAQQQQKQRGENGASSQKIFDRPIASPLKSSKRSEITF